MTPNTYLKSILHIAQLNDLLTGDAECARILRHLSDRVHLLNLENSGAALSQEVPRMAEAAEADPTFAIPELLSSLKGFVLMALESSERLIQKRCELTELIDSHRSYVSELEARCQALADEFKSRGGDTEKYPPIEKP
jgi:hypothetical protein